MTVNVSIKGLGRSGRAALKLILETPELALVFGRHCSRPI
jgi:glyceraldehyde-3-phosphate dehydrogenase/erythrose-4-phosphate dehydrogenase